MSAQLQLALHVLTLAAGFALVLWGLRIFKAYIAFLGLFFGCAVGGSIAAIAVGSSQSILAGAAIGGLLGALLAWPFQKLLVFMTAGFLGAAGGAAIALATAGSQHVALAAIIGFIVGGVFAVALYDVVVITAMAVNGAQLIFQAIYVPFQTWNGSPRTVATRMLEIYADRITALAVTTLLFVGFAVWYQKSLRRRALAQDPAALATRRIAVRLAMLIIGAFALTSVLMVNGTWSLSSFELIGMHALSWPLVCLAAAAFTRFPLPRATNMAGDLLRPRYRRQRRWLGVAAFGATVPPLITCALFVLYGSSWQTLRLYYAGFLSGSPLELLLKWTCALAITPMLLAGAAPAFVAQPAPLAAPPAPPPPAPAPLVAEAV